METTTPHSSPASPTQEGTRECTHQEAWELLREGIVGRLAVIRDGAPDIFPVNYVVDHGTVVIRTNGGTKHQAARNQVVAFEVDGYDIDTGEAWSAVLKGRVTEVKAVDEVIEVMALPLDPWQAGAKPHFLRVTPGSLTGRRFHVRGGARHP
jgi:nitroimidazol reductase NimA-like FMN-containing flavoprotein (pyridoxamine 5'-phosphate oxidase superfamily)